MENKRQDPTQTADRLRVVVGQTWEPDSVQIKHENGDSATKAKIGVIVGFAVLFGAMFAAYGGYGLFHRDAEVMRRVFSVLTYGLATVGAWAVGLALVKNILSGSQK